MIYVLQLFKNIEEFNMTFERGMFRTEKSWSPNILEASSWTCLYNFSRNESFISYKYLELPPSLQTAELLKVVPVYANNIDEVVLKLERCDEVAEMVKKNRSKKRCQKYWSTRNGGIPIYPKILH